MLQQTSVMSNTGSNTISAIVSQMGGGLMIVSIVHTGNTRCYACAVNTTDGTG